MKGVVLLAIFFSLLFAVYAGYAGSELISIGSITVNQGIEDRVAITLDSAPNGLSGYDITVSLRNGEVGDIIDIEFPEWAKLSDKSIRGDSARLKVVDLENRIKPGAANVLLAVIIIGNTRPGESLIELTVNRMDDDYGNPIVPTIKPGKITVIGPTHIQTTATTTNMETVPEKPTNQGKETTITKTITLTITLTEATVITSYISDVQTSSINYLILAIMMVVFFATIVVILTKSQTRRRKPIVRGFETISSGE